MRSFALAWYFNIFTLVEHSGYHTIPLRDEIENQVDGRVGHNRTIVPLHLSRLGPLDTITLSFPACVTLHPADSPLDVSSEKLLRLFCFVTLCLLEKPGRVPSVPAISAVKLTQGCHVKPKQLKWIQEGRTIKIDIFRSYLWI